MVQVITRYPLLKIDKPTHVNTDILAHLGKYISHSNMVNNDPKVLWSQFHFLVVFNRCSLTHLGVQNLYSKYSKGTFPLMSIAHWKHLGTLGNSCCWANKRFSAAKARFSLSLRFRNRCFSSVSRFWIKAFSLTSFSFSFLRAFWAFFFSAFLLAIRASSSGVSNGPEGKFALE